LQIFKPDGIFVKNEKLFKFLYFLRNDLPVRTLDKVSRIPGIGSAKLRKDVEKAKKINKRAWDLVYLFSHFTTN
jgi:hypothetical protein